MTEGTIDLDRHRPAAGQHEAEMRRRPASSQRQSALTQHLPPGRLENRMLAEPAPTWVEIIERWRFLLDRYAATPEADDERIQNLIQRALGGMERLQRYGERT